MNQLLVSSGNVVLPLAAGVPCYFFFELKNILVWMRFAFSFLRGCSLSYSCSLSKACFILSGMAPLYEIW